MRKLGEVMIALDHDTPDANATITKIITNIENYKKQWEKAFVDQKSSFHAEGALDSFRKAFLNAFDELANRFQSSIVRSTSNSSRALQQCRNRDIARAVATLHEHFHRSHVLEMLPAISASL